MAENQTNGLQKTQQQITKTFFNQENVKKRFEELLGDKAQGFISSVLQSVASNKSLANADTNSVFQCAMMAAVLDLPINQNLGFAYIIPFNESVQVNGQWVKKPIAQFQIGWKGFVQLAQRSGQYNRINCTEVYENQFVSYNSLTEELTANFEVDGEGEIVGYAAYFELINGFKKLSYWSKAKVEKHAKKYSQSYKGTGKTPWKDVDQFHEMGKKTVLKNVLTKYGILSIDMQKAIKTDQSKIKDAESVDVEYVDNADFVDAVEVNPEIERMAELINDAESKEVLNGLKKDVQPELLDLFNQKMEGFK